MTSPSRSSSRIAVSLSPELHDWLVDHAEDENRTLSNLVAHVLDKWARSEGWEPPRSEPRSEPR